jgi:hypothetical protein
MIPTYELLCLTYGHGEVERRGGRFTARIAEEMALLSPEPMALVWHESPTVHGDLEVGGVTFSGLLGDAHILRHLGTGVFKVIDYQDAFTNCPAYVLRTSPLWGGALLTFYHRPLIEQLYGDLAPWVYPGQDLDQTPYVAHGYRDEVAALRRAGPLDPRLHYRGTLLTGAQGQPYGPNWRMAAVILAEKYPDEVLVSDQKLPRNEWFKMTALHLTNLAMPGHPWCYREFELMSLGLPLISYPWQTHVEALVMPVPWVHYIPTASIPRQAPGPALDPEQGAEAIIAAHRWAVAHPRTIETIGRRAQQWYDINLTPAAIAREMLNRLAVGDDRAWQPLEAQWEHIL